MTVSGVLYAELLAKIRQLGIERSALLDRAEKAESDLAAANATIEALQADLAGTAELLLREQALAESRSLALATMREALESAGTDLIGFESYFERRGSMGTVESIRRTLKKIDDALAQPDDAAAALAGAVLLAADRMGRALDALVLGDATPAGAHAMLDDYLRARAALRGHGAAEG